MPLAEHSFISRFLPSFLFSKPVRCNLLSFQIHIPSIFLFISWISLFLHSFFLKREKSGVRGRREKPRDGNQRFEVGEDFLASKKTPSSSHPSFLPLSIPSIWYPNPDSLTLLSHSIFFPLFFSIPFISPSSHSFFLSFSRFSVSSLYLSYVIMNPSCEEISSPVFSSFSFLAPQTFRPPFHSHFSPSPPSLLPGRKERKR